MGIDVPSVQLLCCAKSIGVDFSDTMMVGRQTVNAPSDVIASILSAIGTPREQTSAILKGQFAEPLFALLGAKQVSSVDASDFEQATHIHDFNQPLPTSLANQFSVVHDGGTIEHVFNIPQAFKNCMEMVRIGGHFIQVNVANNYMGHGFWQFCPELIYRIFSRENGFQIKAVLMHEPNIWRRRQGHHSVHGTKLTILPPTIAASNLSTIGPRTSARLRSAWRTKGFSQVFRSSPITSKPGKQTQEPHHESRTSPAVLDPADDPAPYQGIAPPGPRRRKNDAWPWPIRPPVLPPHARR